MVAVAWRHAWQEALYGPGGFYRHHRPARHFATAAHGPSGAVLAEALWRWADRLGLSGVVEVGAGRGELLAHLHGIRPGRPLLGCDVVGRPSALPAAVAWLSSPGAAGLPDGLCDLADVLVVAHEWLDVVPCDIAEVDTAGVLRLVLVDPATGAESPGAPVGDAERLWGERHWPATEPGDRVEVGLARDRAWSGLLARITDGVALAVDYGHERSRRPRGGTLTAYRRGAEVAPVPDGTCDLTAHVAVDSLRQDRRLTQAEAFEQVGLAPSRPDPSLAGVDPGRYLRELERAAACAELTSAHGYGGFRWVLARLPERGAPGGADWPP